MGGQGPVEAGTDAHVEEAGPQHQQGPLEAILVQQEADEDIVLLHQIYVV